jgi:hypothetical protein
VDEQLGFILIAVKLGCGSAANPEKIPRSKAADL